MVGANFHCDQPNVMENVGLPLIEEYEARLDAEAVLDAEEAADLAGDDDDDA